MRKQSALGKGLEALFEDNEIIEDDKQIKLLNINEVEPNKDQPRKHFDKEKLNELSSSIAEHGILQPIIVKRNKNDRYQIVSGERRWRAARMAGLTEVPVIIKELDDKASLEIALIENLQREDLNIIEEAKGYKQLMIEFELTQEVIAKRVGKSRPVIANALRILSLPDEVILFVESGELSAGHARALLPLSEKMDKKRFSEFLKEVIQKKLTVRDLENIYKKLSEEKPIEKKKAKDIYIQELEKDISENWGRKVNIISSRNKGKIELEFYNKDDFDNLVNLLKNNL